jgi:hypothetical protein
LEDHWGDIHAALIGYMRDELSRQMPADLRVRIEEYVAVEVDEFEQGSGFYPDVRVIERHAATVHAPATESVAAVATPYVVPLELESPTQREIRIIDRRSNDRIVTAIELLSPTNKNRGRQDYRRKQRQFLDSETNLVEIDLLRDGAWVIAAPIDAVPEIYRGPYRICVTPASQPRECRLYEASYRFPLPTFPVPLRSGDPRVTLDLQSLLQRAYETGRYDDIDYTVEPMPVLPPSEAQWADELLRQAGKR